MRGAVPVQGPRPSSLVAHAPVRIRVALDARPRAAAAVRCDTSVKQAGGSRLPASRATRPGVEQRRARGRERHQNGERRDGIQVVARVADILRHLATVPDGLTPQELADRSGIPRPTIYRIGKALAAEDFVRIMPIGQAGHRPGMMGVAISSRRDIRHEVSPFLQKLSDELDETADLAVLFAGEALYVDQYVSPHVLRIVAHIGGRLPLHCTANGKALLASLTPEQVDSVRAGEARAATRANTITDKRCLFEEVQRVRDTGLSFDLEEYAEGSSRSAPSSRTSWATSSPSPPWCP